MVNGKAITCFVYALMCYLLAAFSLVAFILFVSDLFLPKTVNGPMPAVAMGRAILINVFALLLFGLQHSVMARVGFKSKITRFIPVRVERATYCLATAVVIFAMIYLWVPFGSIVWRVDSPIMVAIIRVIAFGGWAFLLIASFQMDHFELFGLNQTFYPMRGKPVPEISFREVGFYKFVRHPIQTGILIGMWFVPYATTSYLLFALGVTCYILVGLYFEEKDLIKRFGQTYVEYAARVKRLIPFLY